MHAQDKVDDLKQRMQRYMETACDEAAMLIEELEARVKALEDALRPFATYAQARARMPLGGMGRSVHAIHTGTEFTAEITMDHVNNAWRVLNDGGTDGRAQND